MIKNRLFLFCIILLIFSAGFLFADDSGDEADSETSLYGNSEKGRMIYQKDQDDFFVLSASDGAVKNYADFADNRLVFKEMDEKSRLVHEVFWDENLSEIIQENTYSYNGDSVYPYQKTRQLIKEKKLYEISCNEKGLTLEEKIYSLAEKPAENSEDKSEENAASDSGKKAASVSDSVEKRLLYTQRYKYDSENRIILSELTEEPETAEGKPRTVKIDYKYGKFENPDVYKYENKVLTEKTVYESENVYYQSMYFGSFEVKSKFVNGTKKEELYIVDGKVQRRRVL